MKLIIKILSCISALILLYSIYMAVSLTLFTKLNIEINTKFWAAGLLTPLMIYSCIFLCRKINDHWVD